MSSKMFKLLVIKNKKSFTRQWFFIDRQIEMTIFLCNTVINFVCRWTNHAAVWKLFFACISKIESENRYFKTCKHQKSYCWIVCRRLGKMRVFKSPTLKIENYTFKKNNWRVELLNFIFTKKKKNSHSIWESRTYRPEEPPRLEPRFWRLKSKF